MDFGARWSARFLEFRISLEPKFIRLFISLQKYPDLNVNCCDFKGHGALEIAVRAHDIHMIREILNQPKLETDLVYKAVLIAIEENLYDEVSCLLERFGAIGDVGV